jgi:rhamnose transport system ATP-binding protein
MHEGRLVANMPRSEATEESIMAAATGQTTRQVVVPAQASA